MIFKGSLSCKVWQVVVGFLLVTVSATAGERISGSWNGTLSLGLQRLRLVFHIQGDSCFMDSPDQAAMGLPVKLKLCTADSLIIEAPSLKMSYRGVRAGDDTIEGTFSQTGHELPLNLKAGGIVYHRPQTPKAPFPYTIEEVSFSNPADSAVLSGTLTYPTDFKKGKTPVVLLVTGSGQQDRDETVFEHRPFAVIADYLAKNGIASLRYDDRGKAKSTGNVEQATTATFAADAEAGLAFLRNIGKFGKVGLLGHSEGGTIAFMLAGSGKTDFIVSLAGCSLRGDKLLVEQNRMLLPGKGLPESLVDDYCRALERMYEYKIAYGASAAINAQMMVTLVLNEVKAGNMHDQLRENLVMLMKTDSKWLNYFISYDPVEAIMAISCPVMAINGSKDLQVKSSSNLAVIRDSLKWKQGDVVREYEGLNHLFQHCMTGETTEYINIEETISPEVLGDIAEFIKGVASGK